MCMFMCSWHVHCARLTGLSRPHKHKTGSWPRPAGCLPRRVRPRRAAQRLPSRPVCPDRCCSCAWLSRRKSWLDFLTFFRAGSTGHPPTSRWPAVQNFENELHFFPVSVFPQEAARCPVHHIREGGETPFFERSLPYPSEPRPSLSATRQQPLTSQTQPTPGRATPPFGRGRPKADLQLRAWP